MRAGFARLLVDSPANIALGQNTHELVLRWLSALPFRQRTRLVTTDGEFHTLRRQLDRLAEEGVVVSKIAAHPADTLADRVASAVDDRTLAVLMSSVLFETAAIVPGLDRVAAACSTHGAELLIDAYHHLNVVPFDLSSMGLAGAFVTGGGYKYCQLGEGNCFLRVPDGCRLRPILTGWFAEFEALEYTGSTGRLKAAPTVGYGVGAAAFAGATYDPTSHYRAAAVFEFHQQQGLTAGELRGISQRQVGLLASAFEALDVSPAIAHVEPMASSGAADSSPSAHPRRVTSRSAFASEACSSMRAAMCCRLGPAPYSARRSVE